MQTRQKAESCFELSFLFTCHFVSHTIITDAIHSPLLPTHIRGDNGLKQMRAVRNVSADLVVALNQIGANGRRKTHCSRTFKNILGI